MEREEERKISPEQQKKLKSILNDLERHMDEIDKMKESLKLKRTSFLTPGNDDKLLEEISVPPLEMLKAKKPQVFE